MVKCYGHFWGAFLHQAYPEMRTMQTRATAFEMNIYSEPKDAASDETSFNVYCAHVSNRRRRRRDENVDIIVKNIE